jgi:hypothetical protein
MLDIGFGPQIWEVLQVRVGATDGREREGRRRAAGEGDCGRGLGASGGFAGIWKDCNRQE